MGTKERRFAYGLDKGAAANPSSERAAAVVLYETPLATAEGGTTTDIVAAGGYVLHHLSPEETKYWRQPAEAKTVDIGRASASEFELDMGGGRHLRFTTWVEGGSTFLLTTLRERHTAADVRRFAESLRPR